MKTNCKCPVCGETGCVLTEDYGWFFECKNCETNIGKTMYQIRIYEGIEKLIWNKGKWATLKEAKKAINGYARKQGE